MYIQSAAPLTAKLRVSKSDFMVSVSVYFSVPCTLYVSVADSRKQTKAARIVLSNCPAVPSEHTKASSGSPAAPESVP